MATLNMRERRVEARIAYLGALGAGRSTNLEQLGRLAMPHRVTVSTTTDDEMGELLSLDWPAPTHMQLRDCSLVARIVAPKGSVSPARAAAVLKDADGVVVVVDAQPEGQESNRVCVAVVREALATRDRAVPVVLQVNKTDVPGSLTADAVARDLGAPWPHVGAAATNGEGVVETLECALREVLERLDGATSDGDEKADHAARVSGPRAEGNPLLAALRQILREAVNEHASDMETRITGALGAQLLDLRAKVAELTAEIKKRDGRSGL